MTEQGSDPVTPGESDLVPVIADLAPAESGDNERPVVERRRTERLPVRTLILALVATLMALVVVLLYLWAQEPELVGPAIGGLTPVRVIEGPGVGDAPAFSRPLAAAWGPAGDIYVSDTGNGRVCVFSSRGRFQREFGRITSETPEAQRAGGLSQPAGIDVAEDGTVYVADLRAGHVVAFNRRGRYLKTIRPSAMPATFRWAPTDVAVSGDVIAVTDAEGVVLFSEDGTFKGRLEGVSDASPFVRPNGVAFAQDGSLVVSDTNNTRVVSLSTDGEVFWIVNGGAGDSRTVGLPRGVCVTEDGSVFFADAFRFALVRISADGDLMRQYGARGERPASFQYPNDVDVRKDLALVADKENDRAQVVRFEGVPGE